MSESQSLSSDSHSGADGRSTLTNLPRLTALRTFGALAVFIFHLDRWNVDSLPAGVSKAGYVGVAFFFVLSGFVLAWGTKPGLQALTFYRRRFARIWPSHMVTLVVASFVPIVAVARGWSFAAPNVILMQAWLPYRYAYGMNGVAWSLSCEVFFYLVFPVLVLAISKTTPRQRVVVCLLGLCAELAAGFVEPSVAFHFPVLRFPEFLVGVVAGLAYRRGWRPVLPWTVVALSLVLGVAASVILPQPLGDAILAPAFLIALLAAASRDISGTTGFLTRRLFVVAGEVSFAFYLVHELVIVNLRGFFPGGGAGADLLLFLASACCALVLHYAVEKPLNKLLRGGRRTATNRF